MGARGRASVQLEKRNERHKSGEGEGKTKPDVDRRSVCMLFSRRTECERGVRVLTVFFSLKMLFINQPSDAFG